MHDGPNARRHNVLGRLRDWWDSWDGEADEPRKPAEPAEPRKAAEPRRALIPEYEPYEPPSRWKKLRSVESEDPKYEPYKPPSRWKEPRSVKSEDVRFGAFIGMLCLAALLVPTGLIAIIVHSAGLDVPWLSTIAIILGVGALLCVIVAFPDEAGTGDAGGG